MHKMEEGEQQQVVVVVETGVANTGSVVHMLSRLNAKVNGNNNQISDN